MTFEELQKENDNLKATVAQQKQNIDGLMAQFEAHKQLLNEQLQVGLTLRANIIMFQKHNNENAVKMNEMQKKIDDLNAQLASKGEAA